MCMTTTQPSGLSASGEQLNGTFITCITYDGTLIPKKNVNTKIVTTNIVEVVGRA